MGAIGSTGVGGPSGGLHQPVPRQSASHAVQRLPATHSPGHRDGVGSASGQLRTVLGPHRVDVDGRTGPAGGVDTRHRAVGAAHQRDEIAAKGDVVRVDHGQDGRRGNGGVDRATPVAKHVGRRVGRQGVWGGDGAGERRPLE